MNPLLIATSCILAQAILVPFMATQITRESGPKAVNFSVGISVCIGALSGLLLDININPPFSPFFWILAGTLSSAFSAFWLKGWMVDSLQEQLQLVGAVQTIGNSMFDRIDVNRRGVISAADIMQFLSDQGANVDGETRIALNHMAAEIASIGHVTQVFPGEIYSPMPVCVYGISKADLGTYPSRIQSTLHAWC